VRDIAGNWRSVPQVWVRDIAGNWRTVTGGWVRDIAGNWRKFFGQESMQIVAGNDGIASGWSQSPLLGSVSPATPFLAGLECVQCTTGIATPGIQRLQLLTNVNVGQNYFTNLLVYDAAGTTLLWGCINATEAAYSWNGVTATWDYTKFFQFTSGTTYQIRTS
jgi:hypothetical protein